MKEYSKELKNIIAKEDLIGFETIFEGLNIGIKEKFEKNVIKRRTDFDGLSEHAKKNELKKFLSAQIEDLKQVVNKNEFFSIRTEKLERLNGVMIERKEKNENKKMKEFLEKLTPKQADLYKHLSDSVKEYSTKYDYEKVTVEKLSAKLEQVSSLPYSYENNNQIESIMKDMDAHNKKLALAKRSLDNMLERKKTFENNFAAEQINKAMESGISKSFSYNTSSSVLDKYVFPAVDAFDEVYEIQKGTIEGKQVEKIVADFVMKFKNQIQNMQISFGSIGIPEIEDYVARLKQRDDDDFGVNIRDIKKTQKFFTEQIESLKNTKKNEVVDELSKYLQRLARIEGELVKKLKSMNIEIGNVKLAKKRN